MNSELTKWIFYILASIAAALPFIFIEKYSIHRNNIYIFLSILSYFILIFCYIQILKHNKNISVVYPFLKILSILIVVFSGILFFKNKLNITNVIGIVLGVIALILLSFK